MVQADLGGGTRTCFVVTDAVGNLNQMDSVKRTTKKFRIKKLGPLPLKVNWMYKVVL